MPSLFLRSAFLFPTIAAAGLLLCTTAHAAPRDAELESARALFAQAEQDEDAGRWSEAKGELEQVAKVKRTAGIRYHIALCDEHLGRLATALSEFTAAQEQAVTENAQDVLRLVGLEMAPLVARVPRISIRVSPAVPGTEVAIDETVLRPERLGAPIPVDPGVHRVQATAPDYEPARTEVTLGERDVTSVDLRLRPVPTSPPGPVATAAPTLPSNPPPPSGGGPNLVAPILTTALAVALAGVGVGAYFAADSAHGTGVDDCAKSFTLARGACDSLKEPVRNWDWIAAGAWVGAAASATVAIVLWAQPSGGHARPGSARLYFSPTAIGAMGSF